MKADYVPTVSADPPQSIGHCQSGILAYLLATERNIPPCLHSLNTTYLDGVVSFVIIVRGIRLAHSQPARYCFLLYFGPMVYGTVMDHGCGRWTLRHDLDACVIHEFLWSYCRDVWSES